LKQGGVKPDALSQLHDIHLPQGISWWPPAPGWWGLALLVCLLLAGGWYLWRWWRKRDPAPSKKALLAEALREMDQIDDALQSEDAAAIATLSALMRRIAVQLDAGTAGLTGDLWLQWLDQHWQQDDFTAGIGRTLIKAPYRPVSTADTMALARVCRDWLKAQR